MWWITKCRRLLYALAQFPLEYVLWLVRLQAEAGCLRGDREVTARAVSLWVCLFGL